MTSTQPILWRIHSTLSLSRIVSHVDAELNQHHDSTRKRSMWTCEMHRNLMNSSRIDGECMRTSLVWNRAIDRSSERGAHCAALFTFYLITCLECVYISTRVYMHLELLVHQPFPPNLVNDWFNFYDNHSRILLHQISFLKYIFTCVSHVFSWFFLMVKFKECCFLNSHSLNNKKRDFKKWKEMTVMCVLF